MIVTSIEVIDKKKKKVVIDGERILVLYNSEVRKFHLVENQEVDPVDYEDLTAALYKRAKLKAMDLLKRSDKTEQELRKKLKTSNFTQDAIDVAIDYVMSYGYIDDYRYTSNYIRLKKHSKSKRAMEFELSQKGIEKSVISDCMDDEFDTDDELEAVIRLITKKYDRISNLEEDKRQKLTASICRKGFSFDKVRSAFRELENREDELV